MSRAVDEQEVVISTYRENLVELNTANVYGVGEIGLSFAEAV